MLNDKGLARYDFVLSRRTDSDDYGIWRLESESDDLLQPIPLNPDAKFDRTHQIVSIGRYLLEWGPLTLEAYEPCFPYRLFELDPTSKDPLAAKALQRGLWPKTKFWAYRPDFGNPEGAHEGYDSGQQLTLLPLGGFILNVIPTDGRGTFQLWNFDPSPLLQGRADPLPQAYTPQGSFDTIDYGHELIPWQLCARPTARSGAYWLWASIRRPSCR